MPDWIAWASTDRSTWSVGRAGAFRVYKPADLCIHSAQYDASELKARWSPNVTLPCGSLFELPDTHSITNPHPRVVTAHTKHALAHTHRLARSGDSRLGQADLKLPEANVKMLGLNILARVLTRQK